MDVVGIDPDKMWNIITKYLEERLTKEEVANLDFDLLFTDDTGGEVKNKQAIC